VLWNCFTNAEGLVKTWGVAQARVDFRIGGTIETRYDADGKLGEPGTIVQTILSYEPGRMLAIRSTAPPSAPDFVKAWCEHGWHVIRLEPVGSSRTLYTETGCGYGDDEASRKTREFFERGNGWTLKRMQELFAKESALPKANEVFQRLEPLAGAEFHAEAEVAENLFVRARTRWSRCFDEFLLLEGWLGAPGDENLREHAFQIYGVDPFTGVASFWKFGEEGSIARGELVPHGERSVGHLWRLDAPGALPRELYVVIEPDPRGYLFRAQPNLREKTTLVEFRYER
jgi:hypothetical protein